jgi:hypothetical protein
MDAQAPYPTYENIRGPFENDLRAFKDFLIKEDLGTLTPVQCEITYVNHISRDSVWKSHGQLDQVFRNWSRPLGSSYRLLRARPSLRTIKSDLTTSLLGVSMLRFSPRLLTTSQSSS